MNLERVWEYASKFKIQQKKEEFLKVLKVLIDERVKTVLEIGTNSGGTARAFLELGCTVTSVDFARLEGVGKLERGFKDRFTFIHGRSEDVGVRGEYDFVYIDGDHSESGARMDWDLYGSMGKLVGFHDIMQSELHTKQGCEVWKVWEEAKAGRKWLEIKEGDDRWGGWGLVWR